MEFAAKVRRRIEDLGPWSSLLLLLVPICIVEPLKIIGLAIAGKGHWIGGPVVVITAYAASLLVVERLFHIVKPKLLRMRWFAVLWSWVDAAREGTSRCWARLVGQ
jgi:hypothetical protein